MVNKKELLPFCRYYKGEEKNPFKGGNDALFWDYERKWIEFTLEAYEKGDSSILGTYINEYISAGLGQFEATDKAPATLKALLHDRFRHFTGSSDGFKEWYKDEYMKEKGEG